MNVIISVTLLIAWSILYILFGDDEEPEVVEYGKYYVDFTRR